MDVLENIGVNIDKELLQKKTRYYIEALLDVSIYPSQPACILCMFSDFQQFRMLAKLQNFDEQWIPAC